MAAPGFAEPTAADRLDTVQAAYRDSGELTYLAEVELASKDGRWETINATTYAVRWNPDAPSLRLDHPSFDLAWDGQELIAVSPELHDQALVVETPADATWAELTEAFPPLATMLPMPDLAIALAADPAAVIASSTAPTVEAPSDTELLIVGDHSVKLTVSAETGRVTAATTEVSGPSGAAFRATHTFRDAASGEAAQAVADRLADIEIAADDAVATNFEDWLNGPPPAQAARPANALEGAPAPDFTLATLDGDSVKLSDLAASVVVLDFWATWCPPCVAALPELQAYAEWAEAQGLPVEVFAVNLRENEQAVRNFLNQHNLSLTTLMDDGRVAELYGVTGIPQTVIIHDNTIAKVHVGFSPDYQDKLKSDTQAALAGPAN
ncbi:MAG: TlpA disulfide reductase family protein [Planctomycetota bacterium]